MPIKLTTMVLNVNRLQSPLPMNRYTNDPAILAKAGTESKHKCDAYLEPNSSPEFINDKNAKYAQHHRGKLPGMKLFTSNHIWSEYFWAVNSSGEITCITTEVGF